MKGEAALARLLGAASRSFVGSAPPSVRRLFGQLPVNLILFSATAVAQVVFVFRNRQTQTQSRPILNWHFGVSASCRFPHDVQPRMNLTLQIRSLLSLSG